MHLGGTVCNQAVCSIKWNIFEIIFLVLFC